MKVILRRLLSWLSAPGDGLKQRILHSGVWATLLNVTGRGLQTIKLVVLARLLTPTDFGLMGIALLSMSVLNQVVKLGIDSALIQREENNVDEYLDTAWTLKICRGVVISAVVFLLAPLIADFFGEPTSEPILRVLGFSVILLSLQNPAIVYFQKKLEFHKRFVYQVSGAFISLLVAVGTALIYPSVWALVAGVIAGNFAHLITSYFIHSYKPSFEFRWTYAKELLEFGRWIWASGIVVLIATSGDDTFVGWYLSAAALGFYQLAFRLSNAPATEITHVLSSVMFPAFSKLQNHRERLQDAFSAMIRITFLITIPMATGIVLVARDFTIVVFGGKWLPMVPVLQIMAVAGLLRAIVATGGSVFQGVGIPKWDFRMNLLRALIITASIWPLTSKWGLIGAGLSITLGIGSCLPIWFYKTRDITGLEDKVYLDALFAPLFSSLVMFVPVFAISRPNSLGVISAIITGMFTYSSTVFLIYYIRGRRLSEIYNL